MIFIYRRSTSAFHKRQQQATFLHVQLNLIQLPLKDSGWPHRDDVSYHRPSKYDCDACALKLLLPHSTGTLNSASIHEGARDMAMTEAYRTSRRKRKNLEMLFAHLTRILRLDRLRLRGPRGAREEFLRAATAQNHEAGKTDPTSATHTGIKHRPNRPT